MAKRDLFFDRHLLENRVDPAFKIRHLKKNEGKEDHGLVSRKLNRLSLSAELTEDMDSIFALSRPP